MREEDRKQSMVPRDILEEGATEAYQEGEYKEGEKKKKVSNVI